MKNNIFDFFNINFDTEKDENIYNIFESKNMLNSSLKCNFFVNILMQIYIKKFNRS